MGTLETIIGCALLTAAVGALSPWWYPPLKAKFLAWDEAIANAFWGFYDSVPNRFQNLKYYWWATSKARWLVVVLFFIGLGCSDYIAYFYDEGWTPVSVVTGSVAVLATFFCLKKCWWLVRFLFKGFFIKRAPASTEIQIYNPLNRAGVAQPLGEARFATVVKAHVALLGGMSARQQPRFKD